MEQTKDIHMMKAKAQDVRQMKTNLKMVTQKETVYKKLVHVQYLEFTIIRENKKQWLYSEADFKNLDFLDFRVLSLI